MKAVVYDSTTGRIKRQLQGTVPVENQRLADDEALLTDEETSIPDDLAGMMVDLGQDPPEVVDDPEWSTPQQTGVDRGRVSAETKQAFRDARDAGDVQTQLDVLFEVLTGEDP